jgi:two-component system, chemotaxis family, chemotaxis protein CheY
LETNRPPNQPGPVKGSDPSAIDPRAKATVAPTALVIDDDIVIRQFIRFTLETAGWTVNEAENAAEGLKKVRELHPQLVTLDLIMPNNTGLDALHLARLINDEAPEITLLILSSAGSNQDVKEFADKHELELFDKAVDTTTHGHFFSRIDNLFRELSDPMLGLPAGQPRI